MDTGKMKLGAKELLGKSLSGVLLGSFFLIAFNVAFRCAILIVLESRVVVRHVVNRLSIFQTLLQGCAMTEFYTPFYEWAAGWINLSLPEALVLCRIKYWGNAGCFESYATLAQVLKLGQRTVIRAVMSLHDKDLIKVVRQGKYKRTLFFNFSNTNLPLFDKKVVPQCPKVMPERHMINHTKQDKTKEKIILTSEMMKPKKKLSVSAKEKRRKELLKQCEDF